MTDRTLRDKIAAHCRATIGACESGFPVSALNEARAMLEILDAHTAEQPSRVDVSEGGVCCHQPAVALADKSQQPAPDAVAEAAKKKAVMEAIRPQLSEGLGATLRKFCDSRAAIQARDLLHQMPESDWSILTYVLSEAAADAALSALAKGSRT